MHRHGTHLPCCCSSVSSSPFISASSTWHDGKPNGGGETEKRQEREQKWATKATGQPWAWGHREKQDEKSEKKERNRVKGRTRKRRKRRKRRKGEKSEREEGENETSKSHPQHTHTIPTIHPQHKHDHSRRTHLSSLELSFELGTLLHSRGKLRGAVGQLGDLGLKPPNQA